MVRVVECASKKQRAVNSKEVIPKRCQPVWRDRLFSLSEARRRVLLIPVGTGSTGCDVKAVTNMVHFFQWPNFLICWMHDDCFDISHRLGRGTQPTVCRHLVYGGRRSVPTCISCVVFTWQKDHVSLIPCEFGFYHYVKHQCKKKIMGINVNSIYL